MNKQFTDEEALAYIKAHQDGDHGRCIECWHIDAARTANAELVTLTTLRNESLASDGWSAIVMRCLECGREFATPSISSSLTCDTCRRKADTDELATLRAERDGLRHTLEAEMKRYDHNLTVALDGKDQAEAKLAVVMEALERIAYPVRNEDTEISYIIARDALKLLTSAASTTAVRQSDAGLRKRVEAELEVQLRELAGTPMEWRDEQQEVVDMLKALLDGGAGNGGG